MSLTFEWDNEKARKNLRKHGVSFEEAITVFNDSGVLFKFDEAHSVDEDRWQVLGVSDRGRLLLLVSIDRENETVRVISARKATTDESEQYGES